MKLLFAGKAALGLSFLGPFGYTDATASDDKVPPPPGVGSPMPPMTPVRPVTPGTSVNGENSTVRLDPESIRAIAEVVRAGMQQQPGPTPQAPVPAPAPAPAPSPQGYAPAPVMAYAPAAAPVTPVMIVSQKSRLHRGLGHLGTKLAGLGQPTVTQGYVQSTLQQVQTLQATSIVSVPIAASPAPSPVQYVPVAPAPQAPRK